MIDPIWSVSFLNIQKHSRTRPQNLHGTVQVNKQAVHLPIFHEEASELIEQYATAFEKV